MAISVTDEGSASLRRSESIFEPFFTTKRSARDGSGPESGHRVRQTIRREIRVTANHRKAQPSWSIYQRLRQAAPTEPAEQKPKKDFIPDMDSGSFW